MLLGPLGCPARHRDCSPASSAVLAAACFAALVKKRLAATSFAIGVGVSLGSWPGRLHARARARPRRAAGRGSSPSRGQPPARARHGPRQPARRRLSRARRDRRLAGRPGEIQARRTRRCRPGPGPRADARLSRRRLRAVRRAELLAGLRSHLPARRARASPAARASPLRRGDGRQLRDPDAGRRQRNSPRPRSSRHRSRPPSSGANVASRWRRSPSRSSTSSSRLRSATSSRRRATRRSPPRTTRHSSVFSAPSRARRSASRFPSRASIGRPHGWPRALRSPAAGSASSTSPTNPLFYAPHLSGAAYETWLHSTPSASSRCPTPDSTTPPAAEAALIEARPELPASRRPAHALADLRRHRRPTAGQPTGDHDPARRPTAFQLRFARPGTSEVRLHYTPYWAASAGACASRAPDGYTNVRASRGGLVDVTARFEIGRALAGGSTCPER